MGEGISIIHVNKAYEILDHVPIVVKDRNKAPQGSEQPAVFAMEDDFFKPRFPVIYRIFNFFYLLRVCLWTLQQSMTSHKIAYPALHVATLGQAQ